MLSHIMGFLLAKDYDLEIEIGVIRERDHNHSRPTDDNVRSFLLPATFL